MQLGTVSSDITSIAITGLYKSSCLLSKLFPAKSTASWSWTAWGRDVVSSELREEQTASDQSALAQSRISLSDASLRCVKSSRWP